MTDSVYHLITTLIVCHLRDNRTKEEEEKEVEIDIETINHKKENQKEVVEEVGKEDKIDAPNTVTGELVWALKALGYGAPKTGVRTTGT